MKRYFRIALTVLAMVLVTLFSAAITLRIALHGHEVSIPDFAGMTVAEASDAALKTGVDLNIENRFYSTTVPAGRILSQAPAAGSNVRHGWQVRVTESIGPQQVAIPDVVGRPVREASIDIRRNQLDLGTLAHIDAPGDPDMVLAQTPPPNAGVDQPRVNLLLSSSDGGASSAYVMPSFVGLTVGAAYRQANALGLHLALLAENATAAPHIVAGAPTPAAVDAQPPLPSGPIAVQSPEAGSRISRGDTVRLTVGHALPAAATTPTALSAPALPR
jgi:beta-lactam-binding protein with PASTA domain